MPSTFNVRGHSVRSAADPADCWARTPITVAAAKTDTTANRYVVEVPRAWFLVPGGCLTLGECLVLGGCLVLGECLVLGAASVLRAFLLWVSHQIP
jgi:hypothetical protein